MGTDLRYWEPVKCSRCNLWHIRTRGTILGGPSTLIPTYTGQELCWWPVYWHLMTWRDGYVQCYDTKAKALYYPQHYARHTSPERPIRRKLTVPITFS